MQCSSESQKSNPEKPNSIGLKIGQRVHLVGDCRRTGTVKYVGPVEGYSGNWVGVDWDNGEGRHNGSINGILYFHAKSEKSGSFVRPQNLSTGISLLQALEIRYRTISTKEDEDEMYVLSASNRRISVQFLGKDKIQDRLSRFEDLTAASLSYLGVSSAGLPGQIRTVVPNIKELDLTGNLISEWEVVGAICKDLSALVALNLSNNFMAQDVSRLPLLKNICILVLNNTGIKWVQVEVLKLSLPAIEDLHLTGNKLGATTDPVMRRMIGKGRRTSGGLYVLEEEPLSLTCSQLSPSLLELHYCLGYLALPSLKRLCLSLSTISHLFCESCQMAKHHRSTYVSNINK